MKQKRFRVYGSTLVYWLAEVYAASEGEARQKAEDGNFFNYEEAGDAELAAGDIEEVSEDVR